MEQIRLFFSKKTDRGRAVRTGLQTFIAILTVVTTLLGIPEVREFLTANNLIAAGTLATFAAGASYLWSKAEALYKWLTKED